MKLLTIDLRASIITDVHQQYFVAQHVIIPKYTNQVQSLKITDELYHLQLYKYVINTDHQVRFKETSVMNVGCEN